MNDWRYFTTNFVHFICTMHHPFHSLQYFAPNIAIFNLNIPQMRKNKVSTVLRSEIYKVNITFNDYRSKTVFKDNLNTLK